MTRVLTVLPAVPLPATTGLQLRMLEVLQIVRAVGAHSIVLAFETEDDDEGIDPLSTLCEEAIAGGRRVPYETFSVGDRVGQRLQFLSNAVRRRPGDIYPSSVRYDRMGAKDIVADTIARTKPDFVILPSFLAHYAPVVDRAGCKTVIDAADVLTDVTRAFLREYGARNPIKLPGLAANHLAARSQERLFLPDVDEIWCTSEPEAARLSSISGNGRVLVVPNAIPASSISIAPRPDRPIVGFIGTYTYTPNLDAALVLVDDVLPLLRELAPDVRIRLAGTGMPAAIEQRFLLKPNVEVSGPVGDAARFVAGCRVMALPVRIRGGVPLKLVEAMASQRPIVGTSALVSGLDLRSGEALLVADSPRELANAIHLVLSDNELATRLASNARRIFEQELSTEAVIARLAQSSVLARAPHATK
jgi:glycosyltransferase involved in cell wall biosynthesis